MWRWKYFRDEETFGEASSERIFSAGGLTVSHLRCQLDDDKVEDILKIRLNIQKLEKAETSLGIHKVPWYAES